MEIEQLSELCNRHRETSEEKIGVLPTVEYGGLEGTIARTETDSCLELSGGSGRVEFKASWLQKRRRNIVGK